jgi:hypothetical protein
MMTAKWKKGGSEAPSEAPQETTVSEPMQPEETQRVSRGVSTNSFFESSTDIEKRDSAPATPAESIHTSYVGLVWIDSTGVAGAESCTAPSEQYEEESEDPPRQDTSHEDEAEADKYLMQHITASFHPVNITADSSVRVIYPLVEQPPDSITIQAVLNLRPSSDSL